MKENRRQNTSPSPAQEAPIPRLLTRRSDLSRYDEARRCGLSEVASRVLSQREIPSDVDTLTFIQANIGLLDTPETLADMPKAAERLADAVISGECIGLESDYDQDGLGAMATLRRSFIEVFKHPVEKLPSFVGHRLRDGYGLCNSVAERILSATPQPTVLITADNGSSDEQRIARLRTAGIDVIVTDHHALPIEGPPKSAFACINPQRDDCGYPDPAVAGGMVAWLLMCGVRTRLIEKGWLEPGRNALASLLDYVACSTVADCVSMKSINNRALVKYGLRLMNDRPRACWTGIRPLLKTKSITAETISFGIAPRVNAQTRLSSAADALNFLMADNVAEAKSFAAILNDHNEERKDIEKAMVDDAIALADAQVLAGRLSITSLLANGHAGVQGICSSRILERYGRPTFTFCPNPENNGIVTGSGRSGPGIHLRDVLQEIENQQHGLLMKFGGHLAAAGVQMISGNFDRFAECFEHLVSTRSTELPGPVILSDGVLGPEDLSLETLDGLSVLEPTGRGFEGPQFDGVFEVLAIRPVGDGTHLKLSLRYGSMNFEGIWFKARRSRDEALPISSGESVRVAYKLSDNNGFGRRAVQIQVQARILND